MTHARLLVGLMFAPLVIAAAQRTVGAAKPCNLVVTEVKSADTLVKTHTNLVKSATGQYITYYGGGVDAVCVLTSVSALFTSVTTRLHGFAAPAVRCATAIASGANIRATSRRA